jgi:septal ring factor EnvC (AmiA/AmiB activator)
MADDTLRQDGDPLLDGALARFERAEAELEETEERRRRLADEAARAAAELESTLDQAIRTSLAERDRLEDELAAVLDHIARLEAIRTRSSGRDDVVVTTSRAHGEDHEIQIASDETAEDSVSLPDQHWRDLIRSREDSAISP